MYWEIDARSENLVKNGVIRCRSGERVSATLQLRLVSAYGRLTGPLAGKTESATNGVHFEVIENKSFMCAATSAGSPGREACPKPLRETQEFNSWQEGIGPGENELLDRRSWPWIP